MTIKQSTEFNVSIPFKSTTIGLVERASVKYCGRRSAILTRDAQVLSSKFTRTDRRFMNPGFVTDKSVRDALHPIYNWLSTNNPLHYRGYESRKRLNYDLYIQAIRIETRCKVSLKDGIVAVIDDFLPLSFFEIVIVSKIKVLNKIIYIIFDFYIIFMIYKIIWYFLYNFFSLFQTIFYK